MSDFRTRLLGFAALVTAFSGVSYGQSVTFCSVAPQTNPTLRAEGETELLAEFGATCTNGPGAQPASSGTLYISTSLPITSKTFTPAGMLVPVNEATLTITAGVGVAPVVVQGTVLSPMQLSFAIPTGAIPASTVNGGNFNLIVDNVRVNASTGGVPSVTETALLSYATGVAPGSANFALPAPVGGAGFILTSLGATSLTSPPTGAPTANYTTCQGNPTGFGFAGPTPAGLSFTVQIKQLVCGAFKTNGFFAAGGEGGVPVAGAPAGVGVASSATAISLTLNNIPTAATVYVPQTIAAPTGATTLTITGSTAATAAPYNGLGLVALTPSAAGVVSTLYTVATVGSAGAQTFAVPVIVQFAANSAGVETGMNAMNAQVAYSPVGTVTGPATQIPTFVASTNPPAGASAINLCQTSLLFPFITNQLGFDTGIVLSNTSTDNLNTAPGKTSIAAPQSGTCTLSFYGSGTPSPSTGVNDPMGSAGVTTATANPNGPVHAFLLSSVAPGFQGYMIASCPFQYAHGYGFLAYNLTQSTGAVEGYIAEVLSTNRSATVLTGVTATFTGVGGAFNGITNSTTTVTDPVQF
jgi:hypothetical protein